MRIALAFGRWDVERFCEEIPQRAFEEWEKFDCYEPIGGRRDDWNAAMIAYWSMRSAGRLKPNAKIEDFRLELRPKRKPKPQTQAQIRRGLDSFFAACKEAGAGSVT